MTYEQIKTAALENLSPAESLDLIIDLIDGLAVEGTIQPGRHSEHLAETIIRSAAQIKTLI